MKTQWENFLQNLGEWHGSFTQISSKGEVIEDIPSILDLEGLENNTKARLTLRRFFENPDNPQEPRVDELVQEYQSLGKELLFFENGAFSQGSIQIAPSSISGAEFGFIHQNRRLRLLELFGSDRKLQKLTLIREKRAGTDTPEGPPLTVDALLGEWQGEAITLFSNQTSPQTYQTKMQLHKNASGRLVQQSSWGGTNPQTSSSTARIDGSILNFDESSHPVQVFLLADGASATIPVEVKLGKYLFFEAGWLFQPDCRQRLIRSYNGKGEWVSLTLVTERKI